MSVTVKTLGQDQVQVDGKTVHWPSRASRDLFFLLLISPRGLTKADLTERLWGEAQPSEGTSNFKVTQFRLRQALGDQRATVEQEGRYGLAPDYSRNADHIQFQQALIQARNAETREAELHHTYQALSLYRGDFLPDSTAEWAEETRHTLRAAYVRARLDVAQLHCDAVECHAAVRNLATGLAADPLVGENYHQDLMTCLCTIRRPDDAISHYRHYLSYIQRDVGDTPTRETLRLADQIRNAQPHAARHIGSRLACPRRTLYGAPRLATPPQLQFDLASWDAELQRGRQMLKLLHKISGLRDWTLLRQAVEGFFLTQLNLPYVRLMSPDEARRMVRESGQDAPAWPEPVRAAMHTALAAALPGPPAAPGSETAPSTPVGPPAWTASALRVYALDRQPRAWLCMVWSPEQWSASSGQQETIDRVIAALGQLLAMTHWSGTPSPLAPVI